MRAVKKLWSSCIFCGNRVSPHEPAWHRAAFCRRRPHTLRPSLAVAAQQAVLPGNTRVSGGSLPWQSKPQDLRLHYPGEVFVC